LATSYDALVKASQRQTEFIQAAKASLRVWALENEIPLVAAYGMTRLVIDKTDFSVAMWLFFDTDVDVARFNADGTTARVEDAFMKFLGNAGYPAEWLALVTFHIDSHERVERDYQGSYFYYFR
jgi:hypothetical protein